jgi:hypothetical protein
MSAPARTDYMSQGTEVEKARAAADVMVAMEAAKRWPRDEDLAENRMLRVCRTARVAETAFWAFPRSGETLTGSSVYLMRTIATIWGNADFGAREIGRSERHRYSEMLAWAWDLEWNIRISETFIVPWVRDTKDGPVRLISTRDIRDALSNVAQRKVRTQIANLLPDWYVAAAEEAARAVIEGTGRAIEDVRREVGAMLKACGVSSMPAVLHRVGREKWVDTTRQDLATLRIAAQTITREEATIAELFPDPATESTVITAESITAREPGARSVIDHAQPPEPAAGAPADADAEESPEGPAKTPAGLSEPTETPPPAEPEGQPNPPPDDAPPDEDPEDPEDPPAQQSTLSGMFAIIGEAGIKGEGDRDDRLVLCAVLIDRPEDHPKRKITTSSDLTESEAAIIRDALRVHKRKHGVPGLQKWVRQLISDAPDWAR